MNTNAQKATEYHDYWNNREADYPKGQVIDHKILNLNREKVCAAYFTQEINFGLDKVSLVPQADICNAARHFLQIESDELIRFHPDGRITLNESNTLVGYWVSDNYGAK